MNILGAVIHPKVQSMTLTGAASTILSVVWDHFVPAHPINDSLAVSVTTVASTVAGYITPSVKQKGKTMSLNPAAITSILTEFLSIAPKVAAFEAGQAVSLPVPAESYDVDIPNVGKVKVSESGTTITVQKG